MSGSLQEISKPVAMRWFIAYEDAELFYHFGSTDTDQVTSTKLDNLEVFTTEEAYTTRAGVLGIDLDA